MYVCVYVYIRTSCTYLHTDRQKTDRQTDRQTHMYMYTYIYIERERDGGLAGYVRLMA